MFGSSYLSTKKADPAHLIIESAIKSVFSSQKRDCSHKKLKVSAGGISTN
jgi:hypothetical protein